MTHSLSLRRALSYLVFAAGAIPLLGAGLLLFFWLLPTVEKNVADANFASAVMLASQTEKTLFAPYTALRSLAVSTQEYEKRGQLQVALDTLAISSDLFEALYIVDEHLRISALAVPPTVKVNRADFIALDVSGSALIQKARQKQANVWSDVYRSPISDQNVTATVVATGNRFLVGEISLHRLSDFVARLSGRTSTMFILDRRGVVVAHPDARLAAQQVNFSNLPVFDHGGDAVTRQFMLDNVEVIGSRVSIRELEWHVVVTQPVATARGPVIAVVLTLAGLTLVGAALSWWIGLWAARRMASRFEKLAELSEDLAAGRYPSHWPHQPVVEAERLNEGMRQMSAAIHEREQALRELNQTLEEKVLERTASLKQAQATLARSEKLAALGSLVAGVAHELNTPIGNGLMVATSLQDRTDDFVAAVQEGLRKSTLDAYIADCREAVDLVVRNLHRASELVSSFKQVAIDQTTSQRRSFDLSSLIHEITLTLTPVLRRSQCHIDSQLAADILLDSYPGPLGQVLVNLIANAIHHGYDDRAGVIHILTRLRSPEQAEITVSDDGQGIQPANLGRIFDPFFTTRLGRGSSGLGLHICYNIVSNLLGGSIEVNSEPGRGARFVLLLPLKAPLETRDGTEENSVSNLPNSIDAGN